MNTTSKHLYISFILLNLGFIHVLASSLPHIMSSVDGYKTVCEDELVYLTCSARHSWLLSWRSREYVGESRAIEFNRHLDRPGKGEFISLPHGRVTLSQMSKAEHTSLSTDLKIQIPNNFSRTEVTCINNHGERETKTFILAEEPPQPPICHPIETLGQNPTRGTIVYRVHWDFPNNLESTDLRYFELQVGDQQPLVFTNNTQETVVHLQHYSHHNFSIVAVDRCNRRSQPTTCTLGHPDIDIKLTEKDDSPNSSNGYLSDSANSIKVLGSSTVHLLAVLVCFSILFV